MNEHMDGVSSPEGTPADLITMLYICFAEKTKI